MGIEKEVTKLAHQWQGTSLNSKIMLIVYFLIGIIGSSGILSILISPSQVSEGKEFQFSLFVQINKTIFSEGVSAITICFIGIYWISVMILGMVSFIGFSENGKIIFCMLVIIIDVFANIFTYYFIKAVSCSISNLLVFLSVITVISTVLITAFHHLVFIDLASNPKNYFSHRYDLFIFVNKLVENLIFAVHLIIVLFTDQSQWWYNIYYTALILIYGARLYSLAKKRYFLKNTAHYLHVFVTIANLILLIISQLQSFFETSLLQKNFLGIIGLIAFFGMAAFYRFNEHKFQHVILMQNHQVINSGQETFYLNALCQLFHNKTENEWQFLVSGFCRIHTIKQKTRTLIFSSYLELNQESSLNQTKRFLQFQNHVKNVLNYILSHTNNKQVIQQCLYLKLLFFQDVFFVHTFIRQTTCFKQRTIFSKLSSGIILKQIQSIVKNRNRKHLMKIDIIPILNLQSILETMGQIIIKDLNLKSLKWKQLCNDFCKSRQIQENIELEVQNVVKFYKIYQQNNQNYKKNAQFQSLSLFYFQSVILNSKICNEIHKNIKQILNSQITIKSTKNEQNFLASIYSSQFCFLELNISENIEQKSNFFIKNFNKNATKIFTCKESKKLLGINLLQLFPQFILQSVKKLIQNEIKANKGRVLKMYLLDFQRNIFEALVSFRVIIMQDKVSCVMLIEQKKTDNFILLDSQGFIENIGKKYMDLFTTYNYHKLHFSTLLSHPYEFNSLQLSRCQQQKWYNKDMKFLDIEQKKQWWINQTDKIKRWTENKLKMNTKNIESTNDIQIQDRKSKKILDLQEYYRFIEKQRSTFNNIKSHDKKSYNCISDDELSSKQTDELTNSLDIQIRYKRCRINQKVFFLVQFQKVSKSKQKQRNCFNTTNQRLGCDVNEMVEQNDQVKRQNSDKGTKKYLSKTKKYGLTQLKQQINCENSSKSAIKEQDFDYAQSSVNKSVSSTSALNRPLMNFSQQTLECPQNFSDKRLIKFSFLSFVLCMSVGLIIFVGYFVLKSYLTQQRQLMEIDCTVSDSFQLAQLLYNSAITYHMFRKNTQPLQTIKGNQVNLTAQYLNDIEGSYFQQRQLLMGLLLNHQANFDSKHTEVTRRLYFEYLNKNSKWRGLAQKNTLMESKQANFEQKLWVNSLNAVWIQIEEQQIEIVTSQMLMLYNTHSHAVIFNTTNDNSNQADDKINLQVQKSLSLMKVNFPQLKRLNHYNIYYYAELVIQTYQKINMLIYVFFCIHAVFTIVVLLLAFVDKRFRQQQSHNMTQLYTFLPVQVTPRLYSYYTTLKQTFQQFSPSDDNKSGSIIKNHNSTINHQIVKNIPRPNEIIISQSSQNHGQNKSLQSKFNVKKKQSSSVTNFVFPSKTNTLVPKMTIFAIVANFLFGFGLYKLTILNSTIDEVVLGIGSLMDAQNYLLESYFDLKANFIVPNPIYDNEFFTKLLENQQSVDVIFNKIALKSLEIFTKYDPQYSDDFVNLLKDDVCKVIRQVLNDIEYAQCIDNSQMQYFENGIAMTMNFVTRKIYQTILQVQQRVNNYLKNQTDKFQIYEILRLSQHREINQNLFYIFRVFQTVQKRVNIELQTISLITINQCYFYIGIQLAIVLVIFPLWIVINYMKQKVKIRRLYLSLLLLNQQLIGQSARVIQKASNILQFEHGIV